MLRVALAAIHLIALGLGLGAVIARGTALREGSSALRRAFRADTTWGIAAALWLITGLWRLLGETEKSTTYYMRNSLFITKMGLFVLILLLELWPMIMLVRWRRALKRRSAESVIDQGAARRMALISHVEAFLIVLMVIAAAAMARGHG